MRNVTKPPFPYPSPNLLSTSLAIHLSADKLVKPSLVLVENSQSCHRCREEQCLPFECDPVKFKPASDIDLFKALKQTENQQTVMT